MPEPASKERLRLWLRMLKTTRLIEAEVRENLRTQFGTTLPRFDVMSALNQYPDGLKMSELSSVLKVSNGNVTGIVDRLATDGLIQRETVPGDRRVNRVSLTATGRTEFAKQAQAHEMHDLCNRPAPGGIGNVENAGVDGEIHDGDRIEYIVLRIGHHAHPASKMPSVVISMVLV